MKKSYFITVVWLMLSLFYTLSSAVVVGPDEHLWIRRDGKYLKTSPYAKLPNQIFVPVGVGYQRRDNDQGAWIVDTDTDYVSVYAKENGCNVIRFAFWPGVTKNGSKLTTPYGDNTSTIEEGYMKNWAIPFVEACKKNKIYVILDAHNTGDVGMSGALWTEEKISAWVTALGVVADYFKDEPWVLGYELFNEWKGQVTADNVRATYLRGITEVRKYDTKHILFLGSSEWSHPYGMEDTWGSVSADPDPYHNVSYSFHGYPPTNTIEYELGSAEDFQDKWNISMMYAEWADCQSWRWAARESCINWVDQMMDGNSSLGLTGCRARKIGWANWDIMGVRPNYYQPRFLAHWQALLAKLSAADIAIPEPQATLKITNSSYNKIASWTPGNTLYFEFIAPDKTAGGLDSLPITVKGQAGSGNANDSETVYLIETGPNTGIFRGSIATQANAAGTQGNSTLEVANALETVKASYGDYIYDAVNLANVTIELSNRQEWPLKLQTNAISTTTITATYKDSHGNVAGYVTSPITFSASGEGALLGQTVVTPVNGVAAIKLKGTTTPGSVQVTASGSGATGSLTLSNVDYYSNLETQLTGGAWSSAGTNDQTPNCRATLQDLSGACQATIGYEYSTDGGVSWSGINNNFSATTLDTGKWRLIGDAAYRPGSVNGVKLTPNSAGKTGILEYIPGMSQKSWRARIKLGGRNVTKNATDTSQEVCINFYAQDSTSHAYSNGMPYNGYQLVLNWTANGQIIPISATQSVNIDGWTMVVYKITNGVRGQYALGLQDADKPNTPLVYMVNNWTENLDLSFNDGKLDVWLGGIWHFSMSNLDITFATATDYTYSGFSISAKTGSSSPAEQWVYNVRLYSSIPLLGALHKDEGTVWPWTVTASSVPFNQYSNTLNKIKFLGFNIDAGEEHSTVLNVSIGQAGVASQITCASSTGTLIVGGNSATITATIKDTNGDKVATATDVVTFSVSGAGVLEGTTVVNAVGGEATIVLKSTSVAGTATVYASGVGLSTGSVVVTMVAGTPAKLKLSANPTAITSDGSATSIITVQVLDQYDNLVTNATDTVNFTVTGEGILTGSAAVAAVNGVATTQVRSTTQAGTIGITATSGSLQSDSIGVVTQTQGTAAKLVLSLTGTNFSSLWANGLCELTLIAKICDTDGNLVPTSAATPITFTVTGPGTLPGGGNTATVTTENGVATVRLKSTTSLGAVTVTATGSGLSAGTIGLTSVSPGSVNFSITTSTGLVTVGTTFDALCDILDSNGYVIPMSIPLDLDVKRNTTIILEKSSTSFEGRATFKDVSVNRSSFYNLVVENTGVNGTGTKEIPVFIDHTVGGTVDSEQGVSGATLVIPANGLNEDLVIEASPTTTTDATIIPGSVYEFTAKDATKADKTVTFNQDKQGTLSIPYTDTDGDGIVDGTEVKVIDLAIALYDTNTSVWTAQNIRGKSGAKLSLDRKAGVVRLTGISSLGFTCGLTSAIREISIVYASNYPNPFSKDTKFVFNLGCGADVTIEIYTLTGRLIKKITTVGLYGQNQVDWDGKDALGNELANGVYLYKLTAISADIKKQITGKLVKIK